MTKFIVLSVIVLFLFSCKKKDDPIPTPDPIPSLPRIIKYDLLKDTAYFVNNFWDGRRILPDTCKYLVKYQYQYQSTTGINDSAFAVCFAQHDTGEFNLDGGNTSYAVVRSDRDLQGFHLEFKFGKGYDDLSVYPGLVTDSTNQIKISTKFNSRTVIISGEEFRRQGFFVIYYDKP